jgi:hypothetical protein
LQESAIVWKSTIFSRDVATLADALRRDSREPLNT